MRKRSIVLTGLVICAMLLAVGCRKLVPVEDFTNQPVPPVSAKMTGAKVKDAIIRGGASLNWQVVPDGKNKNQLRATLYNRSHEVTVLIPYSTESYSIMYENSANLKYKDGMIHQQYGVWIRNLRRAINTELARIE